MVLSKEKLVKVLSDFIMDDLMSDSRDTALRTMALALTKFAKNSPDMVDRILDNSLVQAILCEEDGEYDVDNALSVIKDVVNEQGKIYLTIPPVPLLYPNGSRLGITASDVSRLISRLNMQ